MASATVERTPEPVRSGLGHVSDVASFLSVSRSKAYDMMRDGTLPYVKLGKSRRIPWSSVLEMIEANLVSESE